MPRQRSKLAAGFATQSLPIEKHVMTAIGRVPEWLQGTLYRNVPNTYEAGEDEAWAWVDALASIHSLHFNGSAIVQHQAKDLETRSFKSAKKNGRFNFNGYMTPKHGGKRPTGGHLPFPCSSPSSTAPCKPNPMLGNSASTIQEFHPDPVVDILGFAMDPNVAIQKFTRKDGTEMLLALTDQTLYTSFDSKTLSTLDEGPCTWEDCKGPLSELKSAQAVSAAHWKYDFKTGEHFNFAGYFNPVLGDGYKMIKYVDGDPEFKRSFGPEFKVRKGSHLSFVHSFHLTQNYMILQQPPAFYSMKDILSKPAYNASYYDADVPTEWHILERSTGKKVAHFDASKVRWLGRRLTGQTYFRQEGVPGSIFHSHTVNAFENADGSITMDFIGWPDMAIFYGIGLELMVDNPRDYQETWEPARLTRCIINASADHSCDCEILVDKNFGLPNFNVERFQSKPYNFVYGTSIVDKKTSDFVDQLVKVDISKRDITHIWSQADCFVTEPVFIANPAGSAEDDGIVLSIIYDAMRGTSFTLVLDAADFSELARVDVGYAIQPHYHGRFCKHYGDRGCVGS